MKTNKWDRLAARRRKADAAFKIVGVLTTLLAVGVLAILLGNLMIDGLSRIDWQFMSSYPSRRPAQAGILSAWVGSVALMMTTASIAIPLGIAAGVYLEEYAKRSRFTTIIEVNIANLAGVPSIIYGLMALGLFVYGLGFGQSIIAAGLALACLVLPIIIVATRESLRAVPSSIREAAYALGATRWQLISHHLLPASAGGIATGSIIAMSRAIGESAPLITIGALTFIAFLPPPPVVGDFPFISFEWLKSPFTAMPIQMFNWVSRPGTDFKSNAAAAGIVLMGMTLMMNAVAIMIRHRARNKIRW